MIWAIIPALLKMIGGAASAAGGAVGSAAGAAGGALGSAGGAIGGLAKGAASGLLSGNGGAGGSTGMLSGLLGGDKSKLGSTFNTISNIGGKGGSSGGGQQVQMVPQQFNTPNMNTMGLRMNGGQGQQFSASNLSQMLGGQQPQGMPMQQPNYLNNIVMGQQESLDKDWFEKNFMRYL